MTQALDPDAAALNSLRLLGPDPQNWVPVLPGIDHDVVVVGGGQIGSTFAFALRRAGISRISVIDAAPDEAHSGVWLTRARMKKLRTPKELPGPELGIPELGVRAWYEGKYGPDAYAALDRLPREHWADYLSWYRKILQLTIRYGTRLLRIEPVGEHFRLHLDIGGETRTETARKVILANGIGGNGGPFVPSVLSDNLPKALYAHTADPIDFGALKGKRIAVLGGAASAFDAAAVALENGAASVHLFARRPSLASLPVIRQRLYPGAYDNYYQFPDEFRWQEAIRYRQAGSTPPPDSIERVTRFENFHLHLGSPWPAAREDGGAIVATIGEETFHFDFAIAGTGYFVDPSAREELADVAGEILLWRDRYVPPPGAEDAQFGAYPYLGAAHEYLEKTPGRAPLLKNIHVFNPAGFVSFGLPIGDVLSIRRDVPAVVSRIDRDLFFADWEHHAKRMRAEPQPDFAPDIYASALWKPAASIAAE